MGYPLELDGYAHMYLKDITINLFFGFSGFDSEGEITSVNIGIAMG